MRILFAAFAFLLLNELALIPVAGQNNTGRQAAADQPMAKVKELVEKLPASDAVIGIDLARLQKSTLPSALSGDPALLNIANNAIADLKQDYGVDLTEFDSAAIGIAIKPVRQSEYDFEPVAIIRGSINLQALMTSLIERGDGQVTSEVIQGKTVYLIRRKPNEIQADTAAKPNENTKKQLFAGLQREIAVAALDASTLVIGMPVRVRLAITQPGRLDPQIKSYFIKATGTTAKFAAKVPHGMAGLLPIESDDLGQSIESIRFIYGGLSDTPAGVQFLVYGVTATEAAALSLKETLEGVQMLGKALLGGAKGADKALYARLLSNVTFSTSGNQVIMRLELANADLSTLLAMLAK
jgi:hypothetical protein